MSLLSILTGGGLRADDGGNRDVLDDFWYAPIGAPTDCTQSGCHQ